MNRSNDLTQGSIWKKLILYAAPLVASNVLQAMYAMVDMIVAGHFVGTGAISAITNGSQVMMMATNIIIGLTTGGNILIGQYFGARDGENCKSTAETLFSGGMALGAVLAVLMAALSRPLMALLGAPSLDDAAQYLRICSAGTVFITGYNVAGACLRGVGNSRAPMVCIACSTVSNVVLDILFVGPCDWGVAGAAAATVISQAISFLIGLRFLLKSPNLFGIRLTHLSLRRDKLKMILKLGVPCAVQMSIASISWLTVTYIVNDYGVCVSAASGIAAKIKDLCQLFIVAMSSAASGMVAQCIGAQDYPRARRALYTAMAVSVGLSALLAAAVELFAPAMAGLFTQDAETAAWVVKNLRIEIPGQLFFACFLVYHALGLGSGDTWFVLLSSLINCILVRVPLAFWFNAAYGITGVYWACMIAPFSSVPFGFWYERSGRWMHAAIRENRKTIRRSYHA